jgi:hypothetical protein
MLILVGAGLIAWTLATRSTQSTRRRVTLGLLQSGSWALLLLLLWRPVLNVERVQDRQNVVAVLLDASASMAYGEGDQSRLQQAVAAVKTRALPDLERTFAVNFFSFAERTQSLPKLDAVPAPGPQTRIGDALREVSQTASSVPLAAIVLLSDGAENGDSLSEERLSELASLGVPVHTVGFGPETIDNDLELQRVELPEQALPGETLTADVTIRHDGKTKTRLRVYDGEQLLTAPELDLTAKAGVSTRTVELPGGVAGVRDLKFVLEPLAKERNVINNQRRQVVDVLPERRNILYIEGEPRWEFKFIRRASQMDSSLRLASLLRATPNRYYRQGIDSADELRDGLPTDPAQLFGFDTIIIGSLEAAALTAEQHRWLTEFVDRRGGSLIMLAGRDGLADGGWGRAAIAPALPADLSKGSAKTFVRMPMKAQLTVYGAESAIGRFDSDPARNLKLWQSLPGLSDFQSVGKLKPGAVVLMEGAGAQGHQPLLVWQHYGRGNTYLLGTASTWHWQMRLPSTDRRHQMFWRQLLHAAAAAAPPKVSIAAERKIYADERNVVLHAEVRDERFEPIDNAAVTLTVQSEQGGTWQQPMQLAGDTEGGYTTSIDVPAPGLYRVEMDAKVGTRSVGSAVTHFRRDEGLSEHFETAQNRPLLTRIAEQTGGRYWSPTELGGLAEAIRYSKAGMVEQQSLPLWNVPALFLLLLLLKGGEWLLRLRWKTV